MDTMSENEFDVIDQLYFVTSFEDLLELTGLKESVLLDTLADLISKSWVKCLVDPDNEISVTTEELKINYGKYQYLATKQGMLAHNKR